MTPTPRVFVSTGGERTTRPSDAARRLVAAGITAVELSGGQPEAGLAESLASLRKECELQVHNYFPPPHQPFVLNLATADAELARRAIEMGHHSIRLAHDLGSPRYSVHAGFRLDPATSELGRGVGRRQLASANDAIERFLTRIDGLAAFGRPLGVEILIENNVLSPQNLSQFGENPFLAVTPEEVEHIMARVPAGVGFLLDVAHWKVSATSLGRGLHEMIERCGRFVRGCHLSDNDGTSDDNRPIEEDSWFWPHLPRSLPFCTLEIYDMDPAGLRGQVELAEGRLHA